MAKQLELHGTIFGVTFDVTLMEGAKDRLLITGDAAGKLVNLVVEVKDGMPWSVSGDLLGNPVKISGNVVS